MKVDALAIAERLGDGRARAYARCWPLTMNAFLALDSPQAAERLKSDPLKDCLRFGDNYIQNWSFFTIGFDYVCPGVSSRRLARQQPGSSLLERSARTRGAMGMAHMVLGYTAMLGDDPVACAAHARNACAWRSPKTADDRPRRSKATADVFLGRGKEALDQIRTVNSALERSGSLLLMQRQPEAAALAPLGRISEGVAIIERQIALSDAIGDQTRAAWGLSHPRRNLDQRLFPARKNRASLSFSRNFAIIVRTMTGEVRRAQALLQHTAAIKMLSERGGLVARINFDLGVLAAMKQRRDEARGYFERAKAGAEIQGAEIRLQ